MLWLGRDLEVPASRRCSNDGNITMVFCERCCGSRTIFAPSWSFKGLRGAPAADLPLLPAEAGRVDLARRRESDRRNIEDMHTLPPMLITRRKSLPMRRIRAPELGADRKSWRSSLCDPTELSDLCPSTT